MSETVLAAGIDGGATNTRAVLVSADGTIAGFGAAGPSNYDNVGEETASGNIRDAVEAARRDSGRRLPEVTSMFLGMAGVVSPTDRETVRRMVIAHKLAPPESISVDHDIRIALAGGLEGREGIVLIAGTGSSTYGRRSDGRNHRTGWGFLLDDRGSGYYLGLQAMIATVMEADGRGAPTSLGHVVRARFRFSDIDDILHILYHDRIPVADIASLAPDVIRAARSGDAVAGSILSTGAREIARMVTTVAERLEFSAEFPVTMTGGLVDHPGGYRDLIHAEILRSLPGSVITAPSFPPVIGAALLALEGAGVPHTVALLEKLREQVRLLPAPPGVSPGSPVGTGTNRQP
jgi:N-acetylglucosamine kinase-like BadF-type ATPase